MMQRITPSQVRAARALLNLTQSEVAGLIGITRQALADFEQKDERRGKLRAVNNQALVELFESRGIRLIEAGPDWGSGVMWANVRDPKQAHPKTRSRQRKQTPAAAIRQRTSGKGGAGDTKAKDRRRGLRARRS